MSDKNATAIPLSIVESIVQEIDPVLDEDAYKAAVVVLSCTVVRVDVEALRDYTGYDKPLIEYLIENLKKNDQVEGDLLAVDWLSNDHFDAMGFLATVLCAIGMISVAWVPEGEQAAIVGKAYSHPDDPSQSWSGRGRRPKWLNDLLDSGATLNELVTR